MIPRDQWVECGRFTPFFFPSTAQTFCKQTRVGRRLVVTTNYVYDGQKPGDDQFKYETVNYVVCKTCAVWTKRSLTKSLAEALKRHDRFCEMAANTED